jgi:hypothetical protein
MPTDRYSIIFARGATYTSTLTLENVDDIATATLWRVRCAMPNVAPFLEATTANGMILAGATSNSKILNVSAVTTSTMPLGNGRYDFELEFPGGVVRRYLSNQPLQVIPEVGEI